MKLSLLLLFCFSLGICSCTKDQPISYEEARKTCHTHEWVKLANGDSAMKFSEPDCLKGALLPSFTAKTINDIVIDSAYFENKVSVINFWFIGCKPCEAEMPGFNKLVEKYQDEPIQFLAISLNSPTHVNKFLAEHPFNFEQIAYGEPLIMGNFQHMWAYPFTIVTDKNSKIIYVKAGCVPDDSSAIEHVQAELIPVIDGALKGR